MSTAVALAPSQLVPVLDWMERSVETLDNLIDLLPSYPDDQLVEAYKYGLRLDFCAWRLRAAVAAQVTTRINERQARGRHDLEGQAIKRVLLDLSSETGADVTTLYEDARIEKTFFSSRGATTREAQHGDLRQLQPREFYRAALRSENPQETIERFAQEKASNPAFSTRAAWRCVKAAKTPPLTQALPPLIEDAAVKTAWESYVRASAELAAATSAAGLPLGRFLREQVNDVRYEIQRPARTRREQLLEMIEIQVDECDLIAERIGVDRVFVGQWLKMLVEDGKLIVFEKERPPNARGAARKGYRVK